MITTTTRTTTETLDATRWQGTRTAPVTGDGNNQQYCLMPQDGSGHHRPDTASYREAYAVTRDCVSQPRTEWDRVVRSSTICSPTASNRSTATGNVPLQSVIVHGSTDQDYIGGVNYTHVLPHECKRNKTAYCCLVITRLWETVCCARLHALILQQQKGARWQDFDAGGRSRPHSCDHTQQRRKCYLAILIGSIQLNI